MEIDVFVRELTIIIDECKTTNHIFSPRAPTTFRSQVLDILESSKRFVPDRIEFIQSSKVRFENPRLVLQSYDAIKILTTILKWATTNEQSLVASLRSEIEQKNQEIEILKAEKFALLNKVKELEKELNQYEQLK